MTAPEAFSSPLSVPTELSVEFEARVEALLNRWQRIYAVYGVPKLCSKDQDRPIAEHRVGQEMGL